MRYLFFIAFYCCVVGNAATVPGKIPIIIITDLYHPYQDPGDNLDLINAYIHPQIDLKGVLLDIHTAFRQPIANGVGTGDFIDKNGPREPGIIPIQQLNYIFNKNIPFGIGPFESMKYLADKMDNISAYECSALDLLHQVLSETKEKITILSFGSSRILAVAYNRFPKLMQQRIKMIHLSAGTSSNNMDFVEWNVGLDRHAFVNLLQSNLPVTIYPCAAGELQGNEKGKFNAFAKDNGNTYFELKSLQFISRLDPKIQQYVKYVFERNSKPNFLTLLENPIVENPAIFNRNLHMWEFPLWMQVLNLQLCQQLDNHFEIKEANELTDTDRLIEQSLISVAINVDESGEFQSTATKYKSNKYIYHRNNASEYEQAMNEALPNYWRRKLSKIN